MKISFANPVVFYGTLGVLGAALVGYFVYRQKNSQYAGTGLLGFLGSTADAASGGTLSKVGESVGGLVSDVFQKGPDLMTYAVYFPTIDGKQHAVNSSDIDKSGYFYRDGIRYVLTIQADKKIAWPA